ncbi:hypothetical protein F4774DRAFT_378904 [Daldinia eschscholtzii]|nr:hypothetical protein F4774DRAFT_378904 [Daldinia eschscholtzii]
MLLAGAAIAPVVTNRLGVVLAGALMHSCTWVVDSKDLKTIEFVLGIDVIRPVCGSHAGLGSTRVYEGIDASAMVFSTVLSRSSRF